MNVKLLRKVARHILAEPKRYDQNTIIRTGEPGEGYKDTKFPPCGTVACIGGWITLLAYKRRPRSLESLNFKRLAKIVGVKYEQIDKLCSYVWNDNEDDGWPEKFRVAYERATTPRQRARIAANRIEHFIKTGE